MTYTAAEAAVRTGLSSEKVSDTNKKVITSSKRTSDNVDSLANIEKGKKETKKMNNDKKSEAKGNSVTNDSVPTDNGMKNEEPMLKQLNSAYKKFSENGNGTSKTVKKGDSSEQSEKSVKDVKNNGKQSDINKASTASNAKKEKDSSTSVDTKDNTKAKNDDKGASTDASKTDDKASLTTLTDSVSNLALDNSEKNNERKSNRRNRNKKDVIMDTTTGNSNIPKTERKASPTTVDGKLSEGSVRIIDVESNTIHERVDVPVKAPAVSNEDPLPKRNKKGKNGKFFSINYRTYIAVISLHLAVE